MQALPKWVLANRYPAIHDFESLTVVEQTARLYGAMNELITEFNNTVDTLRKYMEEETNNREKFETDLTKVIREFICSWDQKNADLEGFARTIINNALQAGTITIQEVYDPEKESLKLVMGGEV